MSEYIDLVKNPHMRAYLDSIRQKNKAYMSKCYKCSSMSIGIIAEGYLIYPACKFHMALSDTLRENADLLERLGSDYDENGVPYWEST